MIPGRRLGALLLAAVLLGATTPVPGWADDDERAAEAALAAGAARPMHELLARVQAEFGGRVLKVELEHEDDGAGPPWVYEVKLLTEGGDVLKLEYHAGTLELLKLKGRHRGREDD
jgi:uncharacterized membrane protein YkoI